MYSRVFFPEFVDPHKNMFFFFFFPSVSYLKVGFLLYAAIAIIFSKHLFFVLSDDFDKTSNTQTLVVHSVLQSFNIRLTILLARDIAHVN